MFSQTQKPPLGSQINFDHPLAKGLVGCWLMNEGSGNKIYDLSGNKNDGSFVGNTTFSPGRGGSSLLFDGTEDYVTIKSNPYKMDKVRANGLTFSAWIYPIYPGATRYQGIIGGVDAIGNANFSAGGISHSIGTESSNVNMEIYDGTGYRLASVLICATAHASRWSHVVGVLDSTKSLIQIYLNGIFGSSNTFTPSGATLEPNVFRIGEKFGADYPSFSGLIDNSCVWLRPLSPQEVSQLHRSPYAMFERRPVWMDYVAAGGGGLVMPVAMHHYKMMRN